MIAPESGPPNQGQVTLPIAGELAPGAPYCPVSDDQDPFAVLAELDPATSWKATADQWSERALRGLRDGKELEISFHDSLLRFIVGSTGLVLWNQQDNSRHSADPGLALLRENRVVRNSAEGLIRLYIPGGSVSNLRTRVFTENRPPLAGCQEMPTNRHMVDLQIQTATDKPQFCFSPAELDDGSKLRRIEAMGRWFSLPLEEVHMALV
jgi:hypothetical protein